MSNIYAYLDTNGDGTGSISATGNYASAAEDFYYTCSGDSVDIARMIVMARDTGAFDADEYGNGITLTNGIDVLTYDEETQVETSLLGTNLIKTNAEWGALCYDVDVKTWGTGDEFLLVRWTFSKAGEEIELTPGDKFIVRLNDNFTGLNDHRFQIQGNTK